MVSDHAFVSTNRPRGLAGAFGAGAPGVGRHAQRGQGRLILENQAFRLRMLPMDCAVALAWAAPLLMISEWVRG